MDNNNEQFQHHNLRGAANVYNCRFGTDNDVGFDPADDDLHLTPVDNDVPADYHFDFDSWLTHYYKPGASYKSVIFDDDLEFDNLSSYCEHDDHFGVTAVICAARAELLDHLYDLACSYLHNDDD